MNINKKNGDKIFIFCFIYLCSIIFLTLCAPLISPYDPNEQDIMNKLQHPSVQHWLGTDQLGRDILSRLLHGGRTTLLFSISTTIIVILIGLFLAYLSIMYSRKLDYIISFFTNTLLSIPSEMVTLILIGILGTNIPTIFLAITLSKIPWYVKMFREEINYYKEKNYIKFSIISGKSKIWIMKNHLFFNLFDSIVVYSTLNLSSIIVSISALSFLGIGIQPPKSEWGMMLNDARNVITTDSWQIIPVGITLFLTLSTINYLGDKIVEHRILGKGKIKNGNINESFKY
ncbi:TPA: ABC transporter permease [Enterococcus hirae]|uniref:ABC transporter permease n=1 Tax=Enterococcus hirae TaxID=1354 RepID=UPI001A966E72|nr:ABC transporter permease [Enterococcus hirae]MBO1117010.1 ABC transporter permease [Enterococcus hirae]MBO1134925.1 ABC transporter permease [Enterococcus hirae]